MSKISVVIPTYNQARYLKKCIGSVLSQTRKPYEVIVVDDHSTDQTSKIAKKFKTIKYIRHKSNFGALKTFNDCLRRAKGDYILMVSGDDFLENDILNKETAVLENNSKVGLVFAQSYELQNGKRKLIIHPSAGKKNFISRKKEFEKLLINGDYIPYMTALIPKKVYQKLGFWDENLPYSHDYEFFIRVAKKYKIAYIAEPLATYRIHDSNFHKNENRLSLWEEEFNYIIDKHLKDKSALKKKALVNSYLNLSTIEAQRGNYKRGMVLFLKAMKQKPSLIARPKTYKSALEIAKNLKSQKLQNPKSSEVKLVLGCGSIPMHPMHYKWIDNSWIFTDLYPQNKNVTKMDVRNIPYRTSSVDRLYASHVLEHISHLETEKTLQEWYRVLKPKGKVIINVPDLEWACEMFLNNYRKNIQIPGNAYKNYKDLLKVFYGPQNTNGEIHHTGFTQKSLEKALKTAGFSKTNVQKSFDAHQIGVLIATAIK